MKAATLAAKTSGFVQFMVSESLDTFGIRMQRVNHPVILSIELILSLKLIAFILDLNREGYIKDLTEDGREFIGL